MQSCRLRAGLTAILGFVVEPFHGGILDRAMHAFNLTIGPRMVRFGQPGFDAIGFANHVEALWSGINVVALTLTSIFTTCVISVFQVDDSFLSSLESTYPAGPKVAGSIILGGGEGDIQLVLVPAQHRRLRRLIHSSARIGP